MLRQAAPQVRLSMHLLEKRVSQQPQASVWSSMLTQSIRGEEPHLNHLTTAQEGGHILQHLLSAGM